MTTVPSEMGQMAVCCQNLTLSALSSRSVLSVLVGMLFKKFGLFLNMPRMRMCLEQNEGQYHNIKLGSISFESGA
jgi:hypothetical protein